MPIDKKNIGNCDGSRKIRRVSQSDATTSAGLPPPPLHIPYEHTIKDKMCFHSITVMKPFQNYSFEELRYFSPPVKRSVENMLVRPNGDGTYSATWTPASVGCYSIVACIDGYDMEEVYKVEVKEPPQGMLPPNQNMAKKSTHQPSKLRKFVAKNSAGLRIRAHPSLQSEQIGVVPVNGTIAFIDEIHNDDGVWLRLSADTIKQYCNISVIEAWCLQYNQYLGKTLLLPVEEPKTILEQVITDTIMRKLPEIQDKNKLPGTSVTYQVIKCGASGHNVRSRPSIKAPPVGMLVLGNRIGATEYTVNSEGCWVKLDQSTKEKYCFNVDTDAWSLAIGQNNMLYLGGVSDVESSPKLSEADSSFRKQKRGFNFSCKPGEANFSFSGQSASPVHSLGSEEAVSTNPFIFGETNLSESPKMAKKERKEGKLSSLPRWLHSEENERVPDQSGTGGSSVKQFVELGANGNGVTPPDTPKKSHSSKGTVSPKIPSRTSSPVAIPCRTVMQDSTSSSPQIFGSPRSMAVSPLVCGTGHEQQARRGSNQSDTSALVSSLTRDTSQSPSQATQPKELSPSPSVSSMQTRCESSPPNSPSLKKECVEPDQSPKKLTQTGTQTSPEGSNNVPVKTNFSIGTAGREERISPKMSRKDRGISKNRPKRSISPATQQIPLNVKSFHVTSEPVKQAMSPSVAEALRAVFAAFLWHEGIVHDAMACASFLKFHPTLPKQGALVVTRHQDLAIDKRKKELTKEEKARQRHSVEVSNAGIYLHIQPATLESLTKSAANASANRSRRKPGEGSIKEESEKYTGIDSYGYQTISVLPPALKSLVYLWEDLTANCLHAFSQKIPPSSPCAGGAKNKVKCSKDSQDKNAAMDKESKKLRKKKMPPRNYLEDLGSVAGYYQSSSVDTLCELCGESFPHPVTYHMHQSHPGCGQHAGGKGYNSGGAYCLGWAGNCGDGGVPGSSWYLLCENCREKYMKSGGRKQINIRHKTLNNKKMSRAGSSIANISLEPHVIMKNNAMFLLDLASSAESGLSQQRRPSSVMPSLSENITPPDTTGPFGPPPPFQCLQSLGANQGRDETILYKSALEKREAQEGFMSRPSTSGQRPLSEVSVSDDSDGGKGLRFHRSVSMGTNGMPWLKSGHDGRIIMMRKRNNSSCEGNVETGSSLLCNPSAALQKLIPKKDNLSSVVLKSDFPNMDHNEGLALLNRPVMQFIMQQHDLDALQLAMKQALRKAMCRVYAMQALNWLLRSVTQPVCLHDLLWWFVTSLTPIEVEAECEEDNRLPIKEDEQDLNICEHPLSDIAIAGDAVHPLGSTFHSLLQTIADLMVLLPIGSALQQMAIRCWGIRFAPSDHSFLHRSQVFSNISKILSRTEEMEDFTTSMHDSFLHQITSTVECLKDITSNLEIKASSRQAMIGSLTDNSTETFWESGDEDRNKTKSLTIICPQGHCPVLVCVHVDNCRDLGNKISSITFYSGQNTDELIKLRTVEVETRLLGGWVNCPITECCNSVVRLELKGPDNSVRVRQIRVLGNIEGESLKVGKQYTASTLQRKNCEAETLRVFRLITSQVFGKLLQGEDGQTTSQEMGAASLSDTGDPNEESIDLREHMVGILFSRSKLTHLQKQVIVHIVQAIRKETERVHDEWEASLSTSSGYSANSPDGVKNTDTYCFEMLSMVLALSGSSMGRAYLSHQCGLLADLLTLLHTGSARVQRQVTSLLRRMLPEIGPESFCKVLGIRKLPARDFSIVSASSKDSPGHFDVNQVGVLDVFLSVIAKALTLQVKVRSKSGGGGAAPKEINTVTLATSIQPKDIVNARWWLRGHVNKKLAEVIVNLIRDMTAGKLSEAWANVAKSAIAENILNLTYLSEEQKLPSNCLRTPTLWMSLASLCVLNEEHVERLSSGQWKQPEGQPAPPRPTCGNHDDGETIAVIQCSHCGNLCADCDRYLHLHRKTRNHQRQTQQKVWMDSSVKSSRQAFMDGLSTGLKNPSGMQGGGGSHKGGAARRLWKDETFLAVGLGRS
nr:unnamed protein product [Callosobruchus chinensis]